MAITNAQQYQQLVNKPADGKRPGYRGDAAYGRSSRSSQATSIGQARGATGPGGGASLGGGGGRDRDEAPAVDKSSALQTYNTKVATGRLSDEDYETFDDVPLNKREQELKNFLDRRNKVNLFGLSKIFTGPAQKFSDFNASINRPFFEKVIRAGKIPGLSFDSTEEEFEKAYKDYMSNRLAGKTDAYGNPTRGFSYNDGVLTGNFIDNDGGGDQPYVSSTTTPSDDTVDDRSELQKLIDQRGIAYRFMADGGMTDDAPVEGGIMDLESGRQMYFLGKLVKKATRAVKKIAKSPIGKAALFAAPFAFNGGLGTFLKTKAAPFLFSEGAKYKAGNIGLMEMLKGGMTGGGKLALGGALTLAPLLFQEEEEQPDYASNRGPGLDIDYIRRNPYETMGGAYRFYAEGGDVEPVAKKTMPLLDMDGKEMDLRADGGFVPIGRMERADDVPARLSKNEFVFTADAVRNAGDGDIDKGAEVMYNMMKNLESGGEVSEESQGLDGAREMFQTSQRLEEVL